MNEREESEDSEKRNVFEKLHCVKRQKAIVGFHKFSGSGILASSDHLHFSSQTSFASLYLFKAIGLKKQTNGNLSSQGFEGFQTKPQRYYFECVQMPF